MLGEIPPWISVQPTDFLRAVQAGGSAGLGIAEAQNRAREAAARREDAARSAAQQQWEFGERMRQAAEENAAQREMEAAKLAQTGEYQQGMLGVRNQALLDAMERAGMQNEAKGELLDLRAQHYGDIMDWKNRDFALREQIAANKVRPIDYETVTETTPEVEGTPAIPAIPGRKRSLLGMDWLMPDVEAKPAVPATGSPRISRTRRIPLNAPQEGSLMDAVDFGEAPPSDEQAGVSVQGPALPMPRSKSELVVGRKYLTSRGEATWDGDKFVK